jgi:hypothetical protein
MYRQILFTAILGAHPSGQLKLFSFISNKFSGKDDSNLKPAFTARRDESAVLACMAYSLIDYCELVDCTGRCIREDKAGYIEQHRSPILARLGLDSEQWLTLTTEFEQHFSTALTLYQHHN